MELCSDRTFIFSLASCNRILLKTNTNKNVTECKSLSFQDSCTWSGYFGRREEYYKILATEIIA